MNFKKIKFIYDDTGTPWNLIKENGLTIDKNHQAVLSTTTSQN